MKNLKTIKYKKNILFFCLIFFTTTANILAGDHIMISSVTTQKSLQQEYNRLDSTIKENKKRMVSLGLGGIVYLGGYYTIQIRSYKDYWIELRYGNLLLDYLGLSATIGQTYGLGILKQKESSPLILGIISIYEILDNPSSIPDRRLKIIPSIGFKANHKDIFFYIKGGFSIGMNLDKRIPSNVYIGPYPLIDFGTGFSFGN